MNTSTTLVTKVKKLTEGEFFIESENGGILLAKAWREDVANQISSALNGKDLDLLNGKAGEILITQLDELAALRADNAKLREALESLAGMIVVAQSNADQQTACLWMSIGNKQGVNEKVETALRVLEETSHAR